jgi:hypothetical protein
MKRKIKYTQSSTWSLNRLAEGNYSTLRLGDFTFSLEPEQISWSRYFVFVTIVANITFSVPFLVDGIQVPYLDISLFHFHNYSLIIWLLPITFFLFGVVQLIPRTYTNVGYDQLFRPLFFTTLLQFICLNISVQAGPGIIVMIGTLISSILLFIQVQKVLNKSAVRMWLQVPFSLYMACLSIITIAAIAGWLRSMGYSGSSIGEISFTILLIVFTSALGAYMTFWKNDFAFPLVIAWSNISLWTEHCQTYTSISVVALSLGIFMIWCSLVNFIIYSKAATTSSSEIPMLNHFSHRTLA